MVFAVFDSVYAFEDECKQYDPLRPLALDFHQVLKIIEVEDIILIDISLNF